MFAELVAMIQSQPALRQQLDQPGHLRVGDLAIGLLWQSDHGRVAAQEHMRGLGFQPNVELGQTILGDEILDVSLWYIGFASRHRQVVVVRVA